MKQILLLYLAIAFFTTGASRAEAGAPTTGPTYGDSMVVTQPIYVGPLDHSLADSAIAYLRDITGQLAHLRDRAEEEGDAQLVARIDLLTADIDSLVAIAVAGDLDGALGAARTILAQYGDVVALLVGSPDGTGIIEPPAPEDGLEEVLAALGARLEELRAWLIAEDTPWGLSIIDDLVAQLDDISALVASGEVHAARVELHALMAEIAEVVRHIDVTRPPVPDPQPGDSTDAEPPQSSRVLALLNDAELRLARIRDMLGSDPYEWAFPLDDIQARLHVAWDLYHAGELVAAREDALILLDDIRAIEDHINTSPPVSPNDTIIVAPPPIDADIKGLINRLEYQIETLGIVIEMLGMELAYPLDDLKNGLERARQSAAEGDRGGALAELARVASTFGTYVDAVLPAWGPLPGDFHAFADEVDRRIDVIDRTIGVLPIDLFAPISIYHEQVSMARAMYADGHADSAWVIVNDVARTIGMFYNDIRRMVLPPELPSPPIPADSATVAHAVERLNQRADSLDVIATELGLDGVSALVDSARANLDSASMYLGAGDVAKAGRLVVLAHRRLDNAAHLLRLAARLTEASLVMRSKVDSLLVEATDRGLGLAIDLLGRATTSLDSVDARLADGRVAAADVAMVRAVRLTGEARQLLSAFDRLGDVISTLRVRIDSLAVAIGVTPVPRGPELLASAGAALDVAAAKLDSGQVVSAENAVEQARRNIAKVEYLLRAGDRLTHHVVTLQTYMEDTLAAAIVDLPGDAADSLLSAARALADAALALIGAGEQHVAGAVVKHLEQVIGRNQDLIRSDEYLSGAIAVVQTKYDAARPVVEASGDSLALHHFNTGYARLGKAIEHLAAGHTRAADAALQSAYRKLEQALYVATGNVRAGQAVEALRARVEAILAVLPADAYYERGAVVRAAELADSASALLVHANYHATLQMVERIHRALDRIVIISAPAPLPPVIDLLAHARQLIGVAQAMLDSAIIGTAEGDSANALIARAMGLAEQVEVALMSMAPMGPSAVTLAEWAVRAQRLAVHAIDILSGDVSPDARIDAAGFVSEEADMDPITADIIAAARAARDAGSTAVNDGRPVPAALAVSNAPNPFNPTTTIRYSLPGTGQARLAIYSVHGQLVRTLIDGPTQAGHHSVAWNGTDPRGRAVASGVYLYRLTSAEGTLVKRMLLVR